MCAYLFEFENVIKFTESRFGKFLRYLQRRCYDILPTYKGRNNKHLIYYVRICWASAVQSLFRDTCGVLIRFLSVVHGHTSPSYFSPQYLGDLFSKVGNVGRRKMKERAVVYGR